ncbi:MAG: GDP-mannose-dependent alpha-(1-6)-phosphatidylinositol monomannoside mannosyltransferase [Candidatus Heimdallarchaeota archaeon LC_3]|nr:MAG: GDP-mannose-dependent alpha-(1-6)-phosphatidylinositol monomannoside mannosyltransferase [Candidatus Heimdallarchaeota archaeon LC_3]
MHICFIEDTKLHGGTQLWVQDAVKYFLKKNWEITIITPENGWLAEECKKEQLPINIKTYDYYSITTETENFVDLWSQALSKCEIAICTVHPPREGFHCTTFSTECIIKSNLEVMLITKTGTIVPNYLREFYAPSALKKSKIITISKTIFQYLIEEYKLPENQIKNIYQGIDLNYFKINVNENLVTNENHTPILGCIGYLEYRKGQKYLLEALSKLKERFPKIFLFIVGDGPDKELLTKKIKELHLENSVALIPFTRDPVKILKRLSILILPSIVKEGLPNVILEAFALKIPVIASNIGGISEVVKNGKTGYIIPPKDVDKLVEAVQKLWEDKKTYNLMKVNAQNLVTNQHNRKRQLEKFEKYFKSLIK